MSKSRVSIKLQIINLELSLKITLMCQSILLKRTLEIFLKNYITPYKQCDFVICDVPLESDKPLFLIAKQGGQLESPFSKSTLILKIENFYTSLTKIDTEKKRGTVNGKTLEKSITKLTDNFRDDLVKVIQDYYDN